jgi:sugar phosphate isomerase/epimerase
VLSISFHPSLAGATSISWPESLVVAGESGFAAIDLVLPEVAKRSATELREQLSEAGIAPGPASLPLEFRLDEERFRRDLNDLPRLAALAAGVGVRTMFRSIPASSELPAATLGPTLQRRVTAIAGILGEQGIDFAVEVLGPLHRRREGPHEFIWRLPDAAEFASACGPDVGLLVDSWHWHHAGGSADEIAALGPMIRHVHVADAPDLPPDRIRDECRLLPGEGIIDHVSFFAALKTAGYGRLVSPEIRGYACQASATECARAAHEAVRAAQLRTCTHGSASGPRPS